MKKCISTTAERPDLYDGYDGSARKAADNPVRVPDRLRKMIAARK